MFKTTMLVFPEKSLRPLGLAFLAPCLMIASCSASAEGAVDVAALSARARALESVETEMRKAGKFDSYTDMRVKLARRFIQYLEHDIARHRAPLTDYAARDLDQLLNRETARARAILAGRQEPVVCPRRVKDDVPTIADGHLEQKVVYPDGAEVRRPVFLFGFGHFGRLQKDIEFLASLGCNFCQVELGPHHVWTPQGKWNQPIIDRYRRFIERADKSGVLVDLLLSPHYMPKWQYEKHPDWLAHSGGFNKFSLDRPALCKFLEVTFQREIRELSPPGNPATVCVMNEPVFFNAWGDPDTRRLWVEYLKEKYGSLDELNDCWETEYAGWGNVPDYKVTPPCPLKPEPGLYDWMQFNDHRLAGFIGRLSDYVHRAGVGVRTHAKAMCREFTQYDVMQGADIDLMSRATDLAGNDWGCILSEEDLAGNLQFAFGFSIMRLASGRPVINTENHLIRGGTKDLRENAVRAPLWLEAVCGLDASAAWSWEKWDRPEGDWTLGMWLYRPRATEEYVRTGMDLMRFMPDIVALRNAPCRVAVLHSRTSALRYLRYAKHIGRTFAALEQLGMRVEVVTERMLADNEIMNKLPDLRVLVLPGSVYLPDNVCQRLRALAANAGPGIRLLGVGRQIAKYNEFARQRSAGFLNDTAVIYRNLPLADRAELRTALESAVQSFGVRRDFTLVDETTGKPVRGVFYRVARKGDSWIGAIVNMTYGSVTCHWVDKAGRKRPFMDRLALAASKAAITLELPPLHVLCGEIKPGVKTPAH